MIYKKSMILLLLMLLLAFTSQMQATPVYNTNIAAPIIFGSGNVNGGFAVNTNAVSGGMLELALRADVRFVGTAPTDSMGNYTVPLGATAVPGKTGSSWGLTFSIAAPNILGYSYLLSFTNLVNGNTFSFNPLLIPDNSYSGLTVAQNSQAPSFTYISVPLGFDVNSADAIAITLAATPILGGSMSSVGIIVHPGGSQIPEPASGALIGIALVGASVGRRYYKLKK
jgi:hypothetical protein